MNNPQMIQDHRVVHTILFFPPLNHNLWVTLFQGLWISMRKSHWWI
jgi:hypothetical protein